LAITTGKIESPVNENLKTWKYLKLPRKATMKVAVFMGLDTSEGWLYLATVKDICTKEIVGWATADNMKTKLCKKALENAIKRYRPLRGLIHHSDRGVQVRQEVA